MNGIFHIPPFLKKMPPAHPFRNTHHNLNNPTPKLLALHISKHFSHSFSIIHAFL